MVLRSYRFFFGPQGHEDDHHHGRYQGQRRKNPFWIVQDKQRCQEDQKSCGKVEPFVLKKPPVDGGSRRHASHK